MLNEWRRLLSKQSLLTQTEWNVIYKQQCLREWESTLRLVRNKSCLLSLSATDPLCILMEFAVFGSLKSYLGECKRALTARPASVAALTPAPYLLCPYHLQISQTQGEYSNIQQTAGDASSLYAVDPAVAAHMQRLLRLLQGDCYYPQQQSEIDTDTTNVAPNYDRLAPLMVGSQCAYRPCLQDDPYCYYPYRHTDYYNQARLRESANQEELLSAPTEFRPTYANVPGSTSDTTPHYRDEDGYNTGPSTCPCCMQLTTLAEYSNLGGGTDASPDRTANRQSVFSLANLCDGGLTQLDVLDFALQIARGMEHLEQMKVSFLLGIRYLIPARIFCS